MDKRDFLKLSALSIGSIVLNQSCASVTNSKYASNSSKGSLLLTLKGNRYSKESRICHFDWDTGKLIELFTIPIGSPHSLIRSKTKPEEFFVFELYRTSAKFNVATKEFQNINLRDSNSISFGHGILGPDGTHLLCSELQRDGYTAVINIRSTETLKIIDSFPSEIGDHSLALLPGTNIVACGSSTVDHTDKKIFFYDFKNKKVISSIATGVPISHLIPFSSTQVIGLSFVGASKEDYPDVSKINSEKNIRQLFAKTYKSKGGLSELDVYGIMQELNWAPSRLFILSTDGSKKEFWDADRSELFKFNFNAAFEKDSNYLITTHHKSDVAIVWQDFKIKKVFPVKFPTHVVVSHDALEFLVLGADKIHRYSLKTLTEMAPLNVPSPILMSVYT